MHLRPRRAPRPSLFLPRLQPFSSTRPSLAEPTNHYDVLGLTPSASASDIKKKFYALSKIHHPDLHPSDPSASENFVRISESYAVLGSAEKRAAYDRTLAPAPTGRAAPPPSGGSYSSHTGARPASGLSRRRTQFRGPPPSFYRSGGWGEHAAKRGEHAARGRGEHEGQSTTQDGGAAAASARDEPGMGPGGFAAGLDNDVPHWDRASHVRTQEGVEKARHRSRRWMSREEAAEAQQEGSSLNGFLAVTGVLAVCIWLGAVMNQMMASTNVSTIERKKRQDG